MDFPSQAIEPTQTDRQAGFLTKTCREYLLGEWEGNDIQKKHETKARTRHAFADFILLEEYADGELKQDIIQYDTEPPIIRSTHADQLLSTGRFLLKMVIGETEGEQISDKLQSEETQDNTVELVKAIKKGDNQKFAEGIAENTKGTAIDTDEVAYTLLQMKK